MARRRNRSRSVRRRRSQRGGDWWGWLTSKQTPTSGSSTPNQPPSPFDSIYQTNGVAETKYDFEILQDPTSEVLTTLRNVSQDTPMPSLKKGDKCIIVSEEKKSYPEAETAWKVTCNGIPMRIPESYLSNGLIKDLRVKMGGRRRSRRRSNRKRSTRKQRR